jgi:hypothetical protein
LRRKEQLGSDRIRGTPGAIAYKCGILTAAPAAPTGAASSAATATSAAASGKTSPTTGAASSKAASTGPTPASSTATPAWTASRASSAPACYTRGLVTADTAWTSELALVATWKSSAGAETTRVKTRKISLIRAQGVAHSSIHQKGLVGAVGRNLRSEFGCGLGLSRKIRGSIGLLVVLRSRPRRRGGGRYRARRQLEREIEISGCGCNLDFAAQMIEAEHIGLYDPGAGRHSVEAESATVVGERDQASFALRRAHSCARDGLAPRLDRS